MNKIYKEWQNASPCIGKPSLWLIILLSLLMHASFIQSYKLNTNIKGQPLKKMIDFIELNS